MFHHPSYFKQHPNLKGHNDRRNAIKHDSPRRGSHHLVGWLVGWLIGVFKAWVAFLFFKSGGPSFGPMLMISLPIKSHEGVQNPFFGALISLSHMWLIHGLSSCSRLIYSYTLCFHGRLPT